MKVSEEEIRAIKHRLLDIRSNTDINISNASISKIYKELKHEFPGVSISLLRQIESSKEFVDELLQRNLEVLMPYDAPCRKVLAESAITGSIKHMELFYKILGVISGEKRKVESVDNLVNYKSDNLEDEYRQKIMELFKVNE